MESCTASIVLVSATAIVPGSARERDGLVGPVATVVEETPVKGNAGDRPLLLGKLGDGVEGFHDRL